MPSDAEFLPSQDREIDEAKARWRAAAEAFDRAEKAGSSPEEQERRLDHWQDAARDFWRVTNAAVINSDNLTGDLFERWRDDRIQTAHNMVSGLLTHQENVRHHRSRLGIPEQKYEFSPAVFENLQSVLAWYRPEDAKGFRKRYEDAQLPTGGFDRPRELRPFPEKQSQSLQTAPAGQAQASRGKGIIDFAYLAGVVFGLLALLCVIAGLFLRAGSLALFFFITLLSAGIAFGCVVGGAFAVYKGTMADTKFKMLGVELSSQNVGVAFMAIGIVVGYFTFTRVLDKVDVRPLPSEGPAAKQ